jgi:hypothetical protein
MIPKVRLIMGYDEFNTQLMKLKKEFKLSTGKDLILISDLERLLDRKLARPKKTGLKSLKGLNL